MKNKITALLAIMLAQALFASYINAQTKWSIGCEVGLNRNELVTDISMLPTTRLKAKNGFLVSVPIEYRIKKWLSVGAGITYEKKNYETQRYKANEYNGQTLNYYDGVYTKYTNTYFSLPIYAKLNWQYKKWYAFAKGGCYLAYWSQANIKGAAINIFDLINYSFDYKPTLGEENNLYYFDINNHFVDARRMEFGLKGGVGVGYSITKLINSYLECNYEYALTSKVDYSIATSPKQYNQTLNFLVGVQYNLFAKKSKTTTTNKK